MKRARKLVIIMNLVLLFGLITAGAASAEIIRGKGWLKAQGSGIANLRMSGQVNINGKGLGLVHVSGAERIVATGDGQRVDWPDGSVIFRGFEGTIHVSGTRMVVKMIGSEIDFVARGRGTAILRGRGSWETEHSSGDWVPEGFSLDLEE